MPSPWKKASLGGVPSLLVSSLRSKAKKGVGESPLVLQAGFPTSVADLVVKNRSRLRKPPRWMRHPRPGDAPAAAPAAPAGGGGSTMATLVSEIIAASAPVPRAPAPPGTPAPETAEPPRLSRGDANAPQPPTVMPTDRKVRDLEPLIGAEEMDAEAFLGLPGSEMPKEETSPRAEAPKGEASGASSAAGAPEKKVREGRGSRGFLLAARIVFPVVILAVVSKKIAMVISILAFAILLVESMGKRLMPLLRPCKEAKKSLGAIAGGASVSDLFQTLGRSNSHHNGRIPSKCGGIAEPDSGSFRSGRNRKAEAPMVEMAVKAEAPMVEMAVPTLEVGGPVEGFLGKQKASTVNQKKNKKKKKLFGKLVPMKLLGTKGGKGGKVVEKLEPASDSGCTEAPGQTGIGVEALEEDEEEDDRCIDGKKEDGEEVLGFKIPALAQDIDMENAAVIRENLGETVKGSSGHLVFFLVVLAGLAGGRIVALALTVLWYSLVCSGRILWRRWISHRSLQIVSDAFTSYA